MFPLVIGQVRGVGFAVHTPEVNPSPGKRLDHFANVL